MRSVLMLCFFLLLHQVIFAQVNLEDEKVKGLGLTLGWTQSFIADQHASPLLYQSDVLNLGALYRNHGNILFEASLILSIGTNQAQNIGKRQFDFEETADVYGEIETFELAVNPFLSMFAGKLELTALMPIQQGPHHLGLTFKARHMKSGLGADDWQFTQVDLGPSYQYLRPIYQGDLHARFSLPVLAGIVRPNYAYDPSLPDRTNYFSGYLKSSSEITSVHKLFNPRLDLGYTYHFQNGKDLGFNFEIRWTSYPDPRPVRILETDLNLRYFF